MCCTLIPCEPGSSCSDQTSSSTSTPDFPLMKVLVSVIGPPGTRGHSRVFGDFPDALWFVVTALAPAYHCRRGGDWLLLEYWMKKERKEVRETMVMAMQASTHPQWISQTRSMTSALRSCRPDTRTMVTMIMTAERQREQLSRTFVRGLIWTWRTMRTGIDITGATSLFDEP